MPIEFDEYRGNKMIVLKRDKNDTYPFRFGLRKAQLIIEHIDDIKKFINLSKKQLIIYILLLYYRFFRISIYLNYKLNINQKWRKNKFHQKNHR